MSNIITIELCQEDRDRLDGISVLLANLIDILGTQRPKVSTPKKATPADAPTASQEQTKEPTPATTQPAEETPAPVTEAAPVEEAKPTVTLAQIQQKVVQLAAADGGAKKAKVRDIVKAYAPQVSELPEDKWGEIWDKLTALEKEA